MAGLSIVDAGPIYAAADDDDARHAECVAALSRPDLRLVLPAMVVAEATYFVTLRLGAAAESAFIASLSEADVEGPTSEDFVRMAELIDRYSYFPLGGTDASVVALAERLGTEIIITLDRRHFGSVRPRHCEAFTLLP